ncbi:MAG: ATP-binding protein, partial [Lautropia sp.]
IDRQARHLQVLVDELLDVARITTGRITLRKEVVPVRSILAAAQEQTQELMARQAHRFRLDTAALPQGLCVEGDPARLIQVVSNLLSNAGKYTEPGGDIAMTVTVDDEAVCIAVQDSGIGIATEMLPHIFDRFAQFDRNTESSRNGLGIGLTLAQRLVALHGGRITAHSEGPGRGSLFTVTLPRHDGEVVTSADASPSSRQHGNLQTRRRVLIVDDNVDAAESLGMLLTMKGHEVHVVHEGSAVRSEARAFRPDVALLDLGLPGRDGFEVARDLREAPDLAGVMLIAVTGYGQEEDRRKTRDAGFAFHLIKPVDVAELLELLDGGQSA